MRIPVLGLYSWYRLTRNHYLMGIGVLMVLVAAVILGVSADEPVQSGKMPALELAIKISRIALWLASAWIGMSVLSGELESLTARTLFTKPVSRLEITTGLLLGGVVYLTLASFIISLEIGILARIKDIPVTASVLFVLPTLLPPLFAVLALSQLFSVVFSKPVTGFFVIGLSFEDFWKLASETLRSKDDYEWLLKALSRTADVLYALSPTYDRFVLSYQGFLRLDFPVDRFILHAFSCLVYAFTCCVLASILLSKKEI